MAALALAQPPTLGANQLEGPILLNHVIAASVDCTPALRRASYDDLVATGRFGLIPTWSGSPARQIVVIPGPP